MTWTHVIRPMRGVILAAAMLGGCAPKTPPTVIAPKASIRVDHYAGNPLSGPTTLMQAVTLAKGPDPKLANLHKVAVFRQVGSQRMAAMFDLASIRAGKSEDPQVLANDTIVVDTSGGRTFLQSLGNIVPLLSLFIASHA